MAFVSIFMLMNTACSKKDYIYPEGSIVGFIRLIDTNGKMLTDNSGVIVTVEGTNINAITNEIGRFELVDVPVGTYNIVCEKNNFGSYIYESFQFIGGDVPAFIYMPKIYQQSEVEVTNVDIDITESEIEIRGGLSESKGLRFFICIGNQEDVSFLNYDFAYRGYWTGVGSEFNLYDSNDGKYHYSAGERVYVIIYSVNAYEEYGFLNKAIDEYIYTSLKQTYNRVEVVVEKSKS
ncbi:carboxypeptidase regulatory-like domain-containing protein [Marinilabiliaceae bacterium A049]|nr:carboxypeptidase regulatory-like domain-containing protein [Marinilabiliaceae bacterium A049]